MNRHCVEFDELVMEEDYGTFQEFKLVIKDDLRSLENVWFLLFDALNFPEFLVCLNGKFVGLKLKTLADEEKGSSILDDIRAANGLVFEVSRGSWPSILKTLCEMAGKGSHLNN
jgi:hypothetical protein